IFDISDRPNATDSADYHRLLTRIEQGAAGILIVGLNRVQDIFDTEAVLSERRGRDFYLVLLDQPAKRHDIADAWYLQKSRGDEPVFNFAKFEIRFARPVYAEAVHLSDGSGQRRNIRYDSFRQVGIAQSLEDHLPREVVISGVGERELDNRQSVNCSRAPGNQ